MQAPMLLTLSIGSLRSLLEPKGDLSLFDLPRYVRDEFELRGLNLPTSMLAGLPVEDLDRLRDRADKAECPCLILVEETPLAFGSQKEAEFAEVLDRMGRLALAASRLGCNALAVSCKAKNDDDSFDATALGLKRALGEIDRYELNLLAAPCAGLTDDPDRLTELIKRVGGFRIGSFPSLGHAAATGDGPGTLRKLAPYAGGIAATIKEKGEGPLDLNEAVEAIRSVGYGNTLAIDFVGKKDPAGAISAARKALDVAIHGEPEPDPDDLEALLDLADLPDVPDLDDDADADGDDGAKAAEADAGGEAGSKDEQAEK